MSILSLSLFVLHRETCALSRPLSLSLSLFLPCSAHPTWFEIPHKKKPSNPNPIRIRIEQQQTPYSPCTMLRFSSGDLSSEVDDVDPNSLPPAARPIQDQPTKPHAPGGPPNMPPPPAPGQQQQQQQLPPQPAGAAPELSLSFGGAGKAPPAAAAPAPPRGVSAPTSPAKSRESLLQRVQSLTGAARDQGASILGMLWPRTRHNNTHTQYNAVCVCASRAQFQPPRRAYIISVCHVLNFSLSFL